MKLVSFSNKRPVTEQGSFLTVSQTAGKLRITAVVAELLGVIAEDYVAVGRDMESGKVFIYAGKKEGKVQIGNKLNAAGQTFEFGSQNSWDELGGTTENSIRYTVVATPVEDEGVNYFELVEKTALPKSTRTRKTADGKEEVIDADEAEATEGEVAPVIEAEEAGFTLD